MKRIWAYIILLVYIISVIPFSATCEMITGCTTDYSAEIVKVIDLFEGNGKTALGVTFYTIDEDENGVKGSVTAQKSSNVIFVMIWHNSPTAKEQITLYLSGAKFDRKGFYAVERKSTNSANVATSAIGYINPESFGSTSTDIYDLTVKDTNTKATEAYMHDTAELLHTLLEVLQKELDKLGSDMTLSDLGFIGYSAESTAPEQKELTGDAIILAEDFVQFVKNNPYPCGNHDYARLDCVDKELIAKYQEKMIALKAAGITEQECPEMRYGKLVVSLEKYIKDISFVRGFYATQKYYQDGMDQFISASESINAGKSDLAYSSMKTSAAKYESARDILDLYDQNDYKVAELRECFQKLYSGGTNMATGYYTKSSFLFDVGGETQMKAMIEYMSLSDEVEKITKEIEAIEAHISAQK